MNILTKNNKHLLNISFLLLRLMVGVVIFMVGAGKVMGWFGGMGLEPMLKIFHGDFGIPLPLVYLSFYTEFLGGLLLIVGFLTRPAALAVSINMLVAVTYMWSHGFLGADGGAAWPMSLMVIAIAILLSGPMSYSIDALLTKNKSWTKLQS